MVKKSIHNHHGHHHDSAKNIKTAFFLNLAFTIIEIIGGFLTNSIAIIADALHDLGDSVSLGFSWYLDTYSKKKRSEKFSYGYKRFSLLAALINSIVLIGGSIFVLSKAIPRLLAPEPSNATGMLILAIIGICINGLAVLKLQKGTSLNEKVVSWHLLEDVFGWVAILIISVVNIITPVPILDPLLAIVFTLIIAFNILKNLKKIMSVFLQGTPPELDIGEIEEKIKKIKHVISVHDTHIWTMDGEYNVLTTHVVVNVKTNMALLKETKNKIRRVTHSFNIQHTTIELETENEHCELKNC